MKQVVEIELPGRSGCCRVVSSLNRQPDDQSSELPTLILYLVIEIKYSSSLLGELPTKADTLLLPVGLLSQFPLS